MEEKLQKIKSLIDFQAGFCWAAKELEKPSEQLTREVEKLTLLMDVGKILELDLSAAQKILNEIYYDE